MLHSPKSCSGLREVEALALALGLVYAAFDLAELEQRRALGVE